MNPWVDAGTVELLASLIYVVILGYLIRYFTRLAMKYDYYPSMVLVITGLFLLLLYGLLFTGLRKILVPDASWSLDSSQLYSILSTGISLTVVGANDALRFLLSTTELLLEVEHSCLEQGSIRVLLAAHNKGRVSVRDAEAVIDVDEPKPEELAGMLVQDCNSCPLSNACSRDGYLVDRRYPRIRGELLPWAAPERPISRMYRGKSTDLVHITSVSPGQRAYVPVLDATKTKVDANKWVVRIFSEYGAKGPNDPAPRPFRACLLLSDGVKLKLKVVVYGENVRKPAEKEFEVTSDYLESLLWKCGP